MPKSSILFVNRVYPSQKGASGRLLQDLARGLTEAGYQVTVLTTGSKSEISSDGVITVHRIKAVHKKTVWNYALMVLKLYFAARSMNRHDLVISLTDPPFLIVAGRLLSRKWNSPHINWCQDLYPDILPGLGIQLPSRMQDILKKISRRALKSCTHVVVIGRCMAKYLAQTGMDTRRMVFIPNWPDREFSVEIEKPEFDQIKSAKPLLTDTARKFRVLYAGNLGLAHSFDSILEAAAFLQVSNPEIEFIFVGEGPAHDRLVEERSRRGLENIRLLPHQPAFQLREMMQTGDLHLISLKTEVSGMAVPCKIYSSIASERPGIFVGPEDSEAARLFKEFRAGSVIPQGQGRELADEIASYRMDGNKWFEAHKGAVEAHAHFRPEHSIQRWIEIIKSTIASPVK